MDQQTIALEALQIGLKGSALLVGYALIGRTGLGWLMGQETEGLNTLFVVVGSIYPSFWRSRFLSSSNHTGEGDLYVFLPRLGTALLPFRDITRRRIALFWT